MMRAQDVHGASGDDPLVWELVAERFHASRIERQHIEVRKSQADQIADFEAFKRVTTEAMAAWERGDEVPAQADGGNSGSGDGEASDGDSGDVGIDGRAVSSVDAPPEGGRRRKRSAEPEASADAGAGSTP